MAFSHYLSRMTASRVPPLTVVQKRYRYYWEERPENRLRKLLMQVTLPRLSRTPDYEPNVRKQDSKVLHGLDVVLHHEASEVLQSSRMIMVYLKSQMEVTGFYRMRHELRKMDISMDVFPSHVMRYTLKNSKLENLSSLYIGKTLTVYSEEPKVAEVIKMTKKIPSVALMGGLVDNRFMSANEMIKYSTLPSLEQLHSELSFTLSGICASTYNLLQQNQSLTVAYLSQYIEEKST